MRNGDESFSTVLNPRATHDCDKFIFKPWWIASNDDVLVTQLDKQRCPGKSSRHRHFPCQGPMAKPSGNYTDKMVQIIHEAWKQSCINRGCRPNPTMQAASVEGGIGIIGLHEPHLDLEGDEPFQSLREGEFSPKGTHPEQPRSKIPGDRGVKLPPSFS